ncbi:MAG: deoxyribonuclease V [Candidatus Kaiserbacteria bacterium]|nr:deoxyribonuclease V [Candidatus Kaiserbacteria bacterium]
MEHAWNVSVSEATAIQKALREKIELTPLPRPPQAIAGADISFSRYSDIFHAAVVVFSFPDLVEIDRSFHTMRVSFPYVPGYLSFREVPAIAEAFEKLKKKPDVLVMDGHGIAHPRRLGVATHLSLAIDTPTIGCAKSKLYGEYKAPAAAPGCTAPLIDPKTGDTLGALLRTKAKCKPIFVSPGNRITLDESLEIIRACVRDYRIPVPTRRAHELVNEFRRGQGGA